MPFIDDLLKNGSVSFAGMEKNTGKTECMNYVVRRLAERKIRIGITSIGLDGERTDQVTRTPKPEIELAEGTVFVTNEKHFREKGLRAEILNVSEETTALGRLVTARALETGKVILAGPSSTGMLKKVLAELPAFGTEILLVDGALSRLSIASPAVTDSMVLSTGAALSANIRYLVSKTRFLVDLINLPAYEGIHREALQEQEFVCTINQRGEVFNLQIGSVMNFESFKNEIFNRGTTLYIPGAITDKLLNFLKIQPFSREVHLIVRDFTRFFVQKQTFDAFRQKGGQISVLNKTRLIAVCINPVSPAGITLNSTELSGRLNDALQVPVYDIKKPEEW